MILFLCISNVLTLILCAWVVWRLTQLRKAILVAWLDINSLQDVLESQIDSCCPYVWPECANCEFIEGRRYDLDRINTMLASSLSPDLGFKRMEDV